MNIKMKGIIVFLLFMLFATGLTALFHEGQMLKTTHELTVGRFIRCYKGGKGDFGPGIEYSYMVEGTSHMGSQKRKSLRYSIQDLDGHSFPVVYKKWCLGYNSEMLITPEDFAYYGYTFPDSLHWVLKYIRDSSAERSL